MEKLGALVEIAVETLLSVELRDFLQPGSRTPPSCSCQTIIKLHWDTLFLSLPLSSAEGQRGHEKEYGGDGKTARPHDAQSRPGEDDDDDVVMMTMPTQGGHSCSLVIVSQICVIRLFVPKP